MKHEIFWGMHRELENGSMEDMWDYKEYIDELLVDVLLEKYAPYGDFHDTCFRYRYEKDEVGVPEIIQNFVLKFIEGSTYKRILEYDTSFSETIAKVEEKNGSENWVHIRTREETGRILAHYYPNIKQLKKRDSFPNCYFDLMYSTSAFNRIGPLMIDDKVPTNDNVIKEIPERMSSLLDEGKLLALIRTDFLESKTDANALRYLSEKGLYIEGIFEFAYHLTEDFWDYSVAYLCLTKKRPQKQFVCFIEDYQSMLMALETFNKPSYKDYMYGFWVDYREEICSYFGYKKVKIDKMISSTYKKNSVKLGDYILYKKVFDGVVPNDWNNYIYLPMIADYNTEVTMENSDCEEAYYLIEIDSDIDARFLKFYLNSEIGIHSRKQCQKTFITEFQNNYFYAREPVTPELVNRTIAFNKKNIHGGTGNILGEDDIDNIIIPLLSNDESVQLVELVNQFLQTQKKYDIYEKQLYKNPVDNNKIWRYIKSVNKEDTLELWNESLPFPLASILRRYFVQDSYKDKLDTALYFFEAFSMFFSTIFLSALENGKNIYNSAEILEFTNSSYYVRSSFGNWNVLNEKLSSFFRKQVNNGNLELVNSCFNINNDINIVNKICNKNIFVTLSKIGTLRNEWKGHGGPSSERLCENKVQILESYMYDLQKYTWDIMDTLKLVRPIDCKRQREIYINRVELLQGDNSLFKVIEIQSQNEALDDSLYINWGANSNLMLIPMVVMEASPNNVLNACYFYNRVESGTNATRYVSFHYENQPEVQQTNVDAWDRIRKLFGES